MNQKIIIFDTTLRDGEQALKVSLNAKKKLQIALALEKIGIDIIEIGFPISSPEDFKSAQIIANNIKNSRICGLARCINKDIDIVAESLSVMKIFRIHIFLPTSDLHLKCKLKKNFNQIIEIAINSIKYARKYTDDVQFSCEDASRTSMDNLCRIVEAVIKAGANTINIPDTVGYSIPNQFEKIITSLYKRVPNIDKSIISVHCHNDLGMATGNSISAIQAGARQIEGTVNGIGERAGNTALEEIIMAIKIHSNLLNVYSNIKYEKIYHTSKIVSQICEIPIPTNKAIVGSNAFSHSSGIHQDGVLKNNENYEIIIPESLGIKRNKLNLTARSGRAAIKYCMYCMGYNEHNYDINKLYKNFLKFADKKGQVFDYDLEFLAFINYKQINKQYFALKDFKIQSSSPKITNVSIKILCGDKIFIKVAHGSCCINAIYKALKNIVNFSFNLDKYQFFTKKCKNYTLIRINITLKYLKRKFYGIAISKNVNKSFIESMINALNAIWRSQQVHIIVKKMHKNRVK